MNPPTPYDVEREAAAFHAWYRRAGWDRDHPPGSAQYYAQKAAWLACARTFGAEAQSQADVRLVDAILEKIGGARV
jgi:hypothetical protein